MTYPPDAPKTMNPAHAEEAFQIADNTMIDLLECHAVQSCDSPEGGTLFMAVDAECKPVQELSQADASIQEACEWLTKRGRLELRKVDTLLWIHVR